MSAVIGWTFIASRMASASGYRIGLKTTNTSLNSPVNGTLWCVLRRPAGRNGSYGLRWMPPGSRRDNCHLPRSKPSRPAGAHGPRRIGLTRNSSRGSWPSGPMRDAAFLTKRYVFSGLWCQSAVNLSRRESGFWPSFSGYCFAIPCQPVDQGAWKTGVSRDVRGHGR